MHKRQDGVQVMLAAGPQYIAVCCSVFQCVSVCFSVLQCVAVFHNTYIYIDGRKECWSCSQGRNMSQCYAVYCSILQYVAVYVAVCCIFHNTYMHRRQDGM